MSEYMINIDRITRANTLLEHYIGRMIGLYRPKALDIAILDAFRHGLPVTAGETLARQMVRFNHYYHWRSQVGYEVIFDYFRGFGIRGAETENELGFNSAHVLPVASAKVGAHGVASGTTARVDLIVFGGKYSSLRLDHSPIKIFGSRNPSADKIGVSDIKILFDPMDRYPFPTTSSEDFSRLPEWIRSRITNCPGASICTPLTAHLRDRLVDYYELPFPDDYLDLVSTAEYAGCPHSFEIFGLSKIWSYLNPREYVVVIGEVIGQGYISLLRNSEPGVYFIDHNLDHIPIHMGNSLEAALCRVLDEGADKIIDSSKEYNE